jgi:hypothetical protein
MTSPLDKQEMSQPPEREISLSFHQNPGKESIQRSASFN